MNCNLASYANSAVVRLIAVGTLVTSVASAQIPHYNVTDITNWTAAQLATLPFFKHYRPTGLPLPNAPVDFHFVSHTATGLIAGNTWNVFVGPDQRGVLLTPTNVDIIDSYGDFHWWRTSPPSSATYRITYAYDINWSGTVVGTANLPGTSATSSAGPDQNAITYDHVHGKNNILPSARYGWATCINNRGEIGGHAYGGPGPIQTGFRRSPSGDFTQLNSVPPGYGPTPQWINAQGVIIGMSVPGGWASPSGSTVVPLGKLFGMPLATVKDLNDAGWIVGTSEQWDHSEQYATLWEPAGGTWIAHDLTDLINTPGILLDGVVGINNSGHLIAYGHGDGGPPAYGVFLLTPTTAQTNSCVPDIGRHPESVTVYGSPGASAAMSVELAGGASPTSYTWQLEESAGVWVALSDIPTQLACGGQVVITPPNSNAVTVSVVPCAGRSSYPIRCVVTNSCGSTESNAAIMSVPHMATYMSFGAGCPGSLGVPTLQAVTGLVPAIGSSFQVEVDNLPANIAVMALGLSNTLSGTSPLPLSLVVIGMPNCQLLVDPAVTYMLVGTGNVAVWTWNVPNNPSVSGLSFYNQAFSFEPLPNGFGFAASNGGVGSIGL
jgi:hypothetical protein